MKPHFKVFSILAFAALSFQAKAQTILEIGNTKISKDEFIKMYERNSVKGKTNFSEEAVRDYLNYYTVYKMKLKEAEELRLDTFANVKREFENYKNQLVQSYLKDKSVTEKVTKEAYERYKEELEVGHIFISFAINGDAIQFKKRADSIYNQIIQNNITFEEAAKQFSQDNGTKANGGYIGYITTLQTDYLFENKIYTEGKKNAIIKPFKSSVGWHIVKVYDRRPNQGMVEVQQIMIQALQSSGPEKLKAAEEKLAAVINELKKGTSFNQIVAEYSDDNHSKGKNGMLKPFRAGDVDKKIEDAAFALKNVGDISEPIRTEYGYHILRLVKKHPIGTYAEMEQELLRKIENDQRIVDAYHAKNQEVKKSLGFKEDTTVLQAIKESAKVNKDFYDVTEQDKFKPEAVLFSLGNKKQTARDFVKYIETMYRNRPLSPNNSDKIIDDMYGNFTNKFISDERYEKLLAENKDFKETLNIYKEGIIIYDMNQTNIWKKASDDAVGLENFYAKNKDRYIWDPSFDGKVFHTNAKGDADRLLAKINSGEDPVKAFEALLVDDKNPAALKIQEGRFELQKYNLKPGDLKERKASEVINVNGIYYVIYPYVVYNEKSQKSLQEAKGFLVSDYQEYLEKEWLASLKKKYPVKVNEQVLKTVFK